MGGRVTSGPSLNLLVPAPFAILFLAFWGAVYASIPWLLWNVRAVARGGSGTGFGCPPASAERSDA
jgi:hypothetical protein